MQSKEHQQPSLKHLASNWHNLSSCERFWASHKAVVDHLPCNSSANSLLPPLTDPCFAKPLQPEHIIKILSEAMSCSLPAHYLLVSLPANPLTCPNRPFSRIHSCFLTAALHLPFCCLSCNSHQPCYIPLAIAFHSTLC